MDYTESEKNYIKILKFLTDKTIYVDEEETPGNIDKVISQYAEAKGHQMAATNFYTNPEFIKTYGKDKKHYVSLSKKWRKIKQIIRNLLMNNYGIDVWGKKEHTVLEKINKNEKKYETELKSESPTPQERDSVLQVGGKKRSTRKRTKNNRRKTRTKK